MLLKEQCISISDLRRDPTFYFTLSQKMPVYVFSNNTLVGKLVDPEQWDDYFHIHFEKPKPARELLDEIRDNNG